jgi:hypothetical protein
VTAISLGRARPAASPPRRLSTRTGTRIAAAAVVILVAVLGFTLSLGTAAQDSALRDAAGTAEPLSVAAQDIYRDLSDADATAAQVFLLGAEAGPPNLQHYDGDIQRVSSGLAAVAADTGSSPQLRAASGEVVADLPVYTGLIGTALADARQDLPVGAAYLREASALLREHMLPAAQRALRIETDRLDGDGSSADADVWGEGAVLLVAVAALAVVQLFLMRRTNRLLNPGIAAATLLVLALAVWTLLAAPAERGAVSDAHGHRLAVGALVDTDLAVIQAHDDELLSLAARGEDVGSYEADFGVTSKTVTRLLAGDREPEIADAAAAYRGWLADHAALVQRETAPQADSSANDQALALVTGAEPGGSGGAFTRVDAGLGAATSREQRGYLDSVAAARSDLGGLPVGAAVLAALALAAGAYGINQRLKDYR